MSIKPKANRITNPRLLNALRDVGVELIAEAARRMQASGHRRANLIAENGHRTKWPKHFLDCIREARLHGTPNAEVLTFIEEVASAGRREVYEGAPAPKETIGEGLALEADAECEANKATALLVDEPHCPTRRHRLLQALTVHIVRADYVRRILLGGSAEASAR